MTLKKSLPAGDTYPLKLTPPQREALTYCYHLKPAIRRKVQEVVGETQTISLSRKELNALIKEIGEAAAFAPSPMARKHLIAVQRKADTLLEALGDKRSLAGMPAAHKRRPANGADLLFQFKITLLDIKPPIWRRIKYRMARWKTCTITFRTRSVGRKCPDSGLLVVFILKHMNRFISTTASHKILASYFLVFFNITSMLAQKNATFSARQITRVPFSTFAGGIVVIRAQLMGYPDTLNFIMDTGSAGISLDSTTCIRMNIIPVLRIN